jgi:hypothetical protein
VVELVEDEVELQVSIHNSVMAHNTVGDVCILDLVGSSRCMDWHNYCTYQS